MENADCKWVCTWGCAVSVADRRPENYAKDLTLRYPIKNMLDGSAIRITLSNFCGNEPIAVTRAYAAKSAGESSVDPQTLTQITFNSSHSAVINNGCSLVSDTIPLDVKRGETITISLYFKDFTHMRTAVTVTGPFSGGYYAAGDYSAAEALPAAFSRPTNVYYFLSSVDVFTDNNARAVICYGDSITAQSWCGYLAQRVLDSDNKNTAIVRRAASGTRILRQYDNITYESYGLRGKIRFPAEIPVTAGADTVIIQQGINDIIHPVGTDVNIFRPWSDLPTAEEITDGLKRYLSLAHEYGMKAYLGTPLPIEGWRTYAPFREDLRCRVNDWMRSTADSDGCIDFDLALRNPENPSAFADGFDSGDHLHPSDKAYKKMAATVPEKILTKG
ncbi:MAG: GDSL-type esterase/lipase family protein [Oscillospiraceae bacterium]|nr:GDSL-type esterase/lipase family protein [Oscillospiraceae bacterium]